jgi:hypothetical protein
MVSGIDPNYLVIKEENRIPLSLKQYPFLFISRDKKV